MRFSALLSRWKTRLFLVALHLVLVGFMLWLDPRRIPQQLWYTSAYAILLILTVSQYLYTAGSDPGYVVDVLRDDNSITKDMKSARDNSTGNRKCTTCRVFQPPRSKHCHECNKCVLQFDHHCAWLGTCVGYGNHCRFWWFLCEETILCLWTSVIYASSLQSGRSATSWWQAGIGILCLIFLLFSLLFLVLLLLFHSYLVITNQTTNELTRRKRIAEFRNVPMNVNPYSEGCVWNIYQFCWATQGPYEIEKIPGLEVLKERERYSCRETLYFNCC
ncbi:hypothetical protein GOP47_0002996 [Adiantum capillus-veneris]|uniref:S-acyltransferase n=1 Tax=Adiantum capillus-veneris TaxID=13818 RepID=A0A9D4VCV3_ADICA|nr:hypothetical protein GOP47_0002996 [Adiantum capillus-veneris]